MVLSVGTPAAQQAVRYQPPVDLGDRRGRRISWETLDEADGVVARPMEAPDLFPLPLRAVWEEPAEMEALEAMGQVEQEGVQGVA